MRIASCIICVVFGVASVLALAKPPEGADPDSPLSQWYRTLRQPSTGGMCCSLADCRPVHARMQRDHYEVFVDRKSFGATAPDDWVAVPPDSILKVENLADEPVACWFDKEVHCFVRGSET